MNNDLPYRPPARLVRAKYQNVHDGGFWDIAILVRPVQCSGAPLQREKNRGGERDLVSLQKNKARQRARKSQEKEKSSKIGAVLPNDLRGKLGKKQS